MIEIWTADAMRDRVDSVKESYALLHKDGTCLSAHGACDMFSTFDEAWDRAVELGYEPMSVVEGTGFRHQESGSVCFIIKVLV